MLRTVTLTLCDVYVLWQFTLCDVARYVMLTFCKSYVLWLLHCVQLRLATGTLSDVDVTRCYVLSQHPLEYSITDHVYWTCPPAEPGRPVAAARRTGGLGDHHPYNGLCVFLIARVHLQNLDDLSLPSDGQADSVIITHTRPLFTTFGYNRSLSFILNSPC